MSVVTEFRRAFHAATDDGPALVPDQICSAVVSVLKTEGVKGASLSAAAGGSRVPLGASDVHSAHAERLQLTTGEGPCLSAITQDHVIDADAATLRSLWPLLAYAWTQRTPYRSALAIPLILSEHARGAIDLYFYEPGGGAHLDPATVHAIGKLVAGELRDPPHPDGTLLRPAWLDSPTAIGRQRVWLATGIAMAHLEVAAPAALDRLRRHALTERVTLDHLANRLIERPNTIYDLPRHTHNATHRTRQPEAGN